MKSKILLVLMLSGIVQIMNASAARATDGNGWDISDHDQRLLRAMSTEEIKAAVDAGANINAQDANGATSLIRAVQNGNLAFVEALLFLGADPKIQDNEGHDVAYHADLNSAFDPDIMNKIKNALDEHEKHARDAAKLDEYVDPSEIEDFPNTEGLSQEEIRLKILEARRVEQQAREQADLKKSESE